jgi:hypothetical protein
MSHPRPRQREAPKPRGRPRPRLESNEAQSSCRWLCPSCLSRVDAGKKCILCDHAEEDSLPSISCNDSMSESSTVSDSTTECSTGSDSFVSHQDDNDLFPSWMTGDTQVDWRTETFAIRQWLPNVVCRDATVVCGAFTIRQWLPSGGCEWTV